MKKKSYYARFMEMTDAQRDAEVAEFDREMPGTPGRPLTAAQRARHERARRRMGRPGVGKGAKRLTNTMERGLLKKADRYARKMNISRSELIATGVRVLLKAG
jgi:hypothetical protein